jgi:hypothetical protein
MTAEHVEALVRRDLRRILVEQLFAGDANRERARR